MGAATGTPPCSSPITIQNTRGCNQRPCPRCQQEEECTSGQLPANTEQGPTTGKGALRTDKRVAVKQGRVAWWYESCVSMGLAQLPSNLHQTPIKHPSNPHQTPMKAPSNPHQTCSFGIACTSLVGRSVCLSVCAERLFWTICLVQRKQAQCQKPLHDYNPLKPF